MHLLPFAARVHERDGVRLLVSAPSDNSRQARIVGELRIGKGGCLGVDMGDGPVSTTIWPAGTRLLSGKRGVVVPLVGRIAIGEVIEAAGGSIVAHAYQGKPDIPADCVETSQEIVGIDSGIRRYDLPF